MFVIEKKFDDWNLHKKELNRNSVKLYKAREIWWCSLGVNVGYEQDGTGEDFDRPIVILKGFSKNVCLVVPLTTSTKTNPYHLSLGQIDDCESFAIVSQIRLIDTRRLINKICTLDKEKFTELKTTVKSVF